MFFNLGERSYTHGDSQSVQYGAVIGQVNLAHQLPSVSISSTKPNHTAFALQWLFLLLVFFCNVHNSHK